MRTSQNAVNPKFGEDPTGAVRRLSLPRTRLNRGAGGPLKEAPRRLSAFHGAPDGRTACHNDVRASRCLRASVMPSELRLATRHQSVATGSSRKDGLAGEW